jgi:Raf kinase inhibitor-like YbhB/YbcL family protein
MAGFSLSSSAFAAGEPIPARHGCDGEDLSPPLAWSGVPAEARSLALIVEDPGAPGGIFTHWLGWGIDPGAGGLGEGEAAPLEGRNDFGATGYRGPCPPPGHGRHRYVFRLFALNGDVGLDSSATRADLEAAIDTGALAVAELIGTYER